MKKQGIALGLALGLIAVLLTGCGGSEGPSSAGGQMVESTASAAGETDRVVSEGKLGDYYVKILDCETGLKDCDDKPVIGVTYEFTNQSEDAIAFDSALYATAYQDGVELDLAILDGAYPEEYENASRNIKPGKTLTCKGYYVMTSETDPVEVEVIELIALNGGKLARTFPIAN